MRKFVLKIPGLRGIFSFSDNFTMQHSFINQGLLTHRDIQQCDKSFVISKPDPGPLETSYWPGISEIGMNYCN